MTKLFEHTNGNEFKLGENSTEVDTNYSINKIEEAEVLNWIRQVLIPIVVRSWDKKCLKHNWFEYSVTSEDLRKNLKKVGHHHHDPKDKTTTDVIIYKSEAINPKVKIDELTTSFQFHFYKELGRHDLMIEVVFPTDERKYLVYKQAILNQFI